MSKALANRLMTAATAESTNLIAAAANNPELEWEEVSALAGEQNRRLLMLLKHVDASADRILNSAVDQALATGMRMFNAAVPHVKDPDDILFLAEGVNVLVARVRQSVEQGAPLPMHYMDPGVRRELFLVESFLKTPTLSEESSAEEE